MFNLLDVFGGGTDSDEGGGVPWKSIGFALFGAAALIAAVGYAITRPAQHIILGRNIALDGAEDGIEMKDLAPLPSEDSETF